MSIRPDAVAESTHRRSFGGPALAIGAGLVWSFGGVLARSAEHADAWQYLIWRSVAIIAVIEVLSAARGAGVRTRQAYTSGPSMLVACASLLLASVAFVYAIKNTTAANAAFLAAMAPLVAVVLGRIVLGERLTTVTAAAIVVALTGLVVMVVADLEAGNMAGNIAALLSAVGMAAYTVCIRSDRDRDWSPVLPGYGVMMIVLCGFVTVANGRPLLPPAVDVGYAMVHGGLLIVVGTIWFNAAARTVPAVPMTVFAQSEMVLVPVWFFLRFGERPQPATLIGGALVLLAIVGKAVMEGRVHDRGDASVGAKPTPLPTPLRARGPCSPGE